MSRRAEELTLDSRVGIEEEVVFRDLEGEAVVLNLKTGRYFGLDPVGTRIWQLLPDHSLREILRLLVAEDEAGEQQIREDLFRLVEQLRDKQLVRVAE